MLPFLLVMVLAVATAVPSPESYEDRNLKDISYGGPTGILRFANSDKDHGFIPDIDKQNKIIASVYSPAFLQPIWILDYRLTPLKGRDYKAEFGKPVLVLPRLKNERAHDGYRREYDEEKHEHDRDDKRDQVVELNRLREMARGYYGDKNDRPIRVEMKTQSGSPDGKDKKYKGYNPAWAPLPDVQFAGRNRFMNNH